MTVILPKTGVVSSPIRANLSGVQIEATGLCIPRRFVPNEELTSLGCDSEWILQRTGILSRYHADANQATSDLAYEAARNCLANARVGPDAIDMLIVATMTPDHYTPSTSCLVQARLGAKCSAFDLNAACSGFIYGLILGSQFVKAGGSRRLMLISADKMSITVDPQDPKTYPLFGDGAAASLLTMDPREEDVASGILAYELGSAGELGGTLVIPAGGSRCPATPEVLARRDQYLKMDGRSVFKWAVRWVPELSRNLLSQANLDPDEIDLFIFHQANRRIIDAAAEAMGLNSERVFVNVDRYGNTSAASIPICLHEAASEGRIDRGSHILVVGFGAGLTWGGCILRW